MGGKRYITRAARENRGASLMGYGLLIGLIGVVVLATIEDAGSSVKKLFGGVGGTIGTTAGVDDGTGPQWQTAEGALGSYAQGQNAYVTLAATDPNGDPLTFSLASGSLPDGASLFPAGVISGSVLVPGVYAFTIAVSDGALSASRAFTMEVVAGSVAYIDNATDGGDDCLTPATACRPETLMASPAMALDMSIIAVSDITLTQSFEMMDGQSLSSLGGSPYTLTNGAFDGVLLGAGATVSNINVLHTDTATREAFSQTPPNTPDMRGKPMLRMDRVTITGTARNHGIESVKLSMDAVDMVFDLKDITLDGIEDGIDIYYSTADQTRARYDITMSGITCQNVTAAALAPDCVYIQARGGYDVKLSFTGNTLDPTDDPDTIEADGLVVSVNTNGQPSPADEANLDAVITGNTIRDTSKGVTILHDRGGRARVNVSGNLIEGMHLDALDIKTAGGDISVTNNTIRSVSNLVSIYEREDETATNTPSRVRINNNTLERVGNSSVDGVIAISHPDRILHFEMANNTQLGHRRVLSLRNDFICASVHNNAHTHTGNAEYSFGENTMLGLVQVHQAAEVVAVNGFGTIMGLADNTSSSGLIILIENNNDLDFGDTPQYVDFGTACPLESPVAPSLD